MRADEREAINARLRRLVGSVLPTGAPNESIESTFRGRFGQFFRQPQFWDAFEQACAEAERNEPWHRTRQLMLSYSLPQEINARDEGGESMLTLASTFGRTIVAKILCQVKGDPHLENSKGWSAVHIAAAYNHLPLLRAFVSLGINVNHHGSRLGYTALQLAASVDNVEVLEFFHQSGVGDFLKPAKNGYTILHVAAESDSERCVRFLTRQYPDLKYQVDKVLGENPGHKAAKSSHAAVYRHLVQSGVRVDLENVEGDSAAAIAGFEERYCY